MISWRSCLSHNANQSLYQTPLQQWQWWSETMQNHKADFCFSLLPKSFPLSASMLLFPEDERSCSQDRSLFVGKVKCLRPTSVIPLPLPLVSPAQSAKHTQASQPLGSHGEKKNIFRFCFKKECSLIELWSFSPLNPALHLLRMSLVTFVWTFQWVDRRPRH